MKEKSKKTSQKINVGYAIRHRRKQLNLTLKELAAETGLSVGFISQVERNLTSPSLSSVALIAKTLQVDVSYFLDTPKVVSTFSKKGNREFFSVDRSPVQYCRLNKATPGSRLNSMLIRTPPGYISEKVSHEGEEQIVLLEGKGFIVLEKETIELEAGDSLYYMSSIPHQYASATDHECLWLAVFTQRVFNLPG